MVEDYLQTQFTFPTGVWDAGNPFRVQRCTLGPLLCCAGTEDTMACAASPPILILNVGHDPTLVRTRSLLLQTAGYLVDSSCSTDDAVRRFCSGDFDLVVLCRSIPEEERRRLLHAIRDCGSSIPVIVVAAAAGPLGSDRLVDLTVSRHPVTFLAAVHDLLDRDRFRWK